MKGIISKKELKQPDPNFALTHRNLATYYQRVGNESKLEEHYQKALALEPAVFNREPGTPQIPPRR